MATKNKVLQNKQDKIKHLSLTEVKAFESGKYCKEHGHWMQNGSSTLDIDMTSGALGDVIERTDYCKLCGFEYTWKLSDMAAKAPFQNKDEKTKITPVKPVSTEVGKTKWKIYWWAKTDEGKKSGSDIITIEGDEEPDGLDILEQNANCMLGYRDALELQKFSNYYCNATHCLDYGLVKIERVKDGKTT